MAEIINFPKTPETNTNKPGSSAVTMTLTRNYKGLTISLNLAKLSKEELIEALMPLPSQNKQDTHADDRLALVKKYINQ